MPHHKNTASHARLASLCRRVRSLECAFEDVESQVEEAAIVLCREGRVSEAVAHIRALAEFYEAMDGKSEERLRDLGKTYILIGEILQLFDRAGESIEWFQKAVVIDERDARPYQSMARSYLSLGDLDKAIRCLEQEIFLAPGNYFSYLMLAGLYEKRGEAEKVEECLDKLLSRDPDNVYALHELIAHHRTNHPEIDVEFLRRRLLSIARPLSKKELLIWAFHMGEQGRAEEAAKQALEPHNPADAPYWMLIAWHCAWAAGRSDARKATAKKLAAELTQNSRSLKTWIEEFKAVFGAQSARLLESDLAHCS